MKNPSLSKFVAKTPKNPILGWVKNTFMKYRKKVVKKRDLVNTPSKMEVFVDKNGHFVDRREKNKKK
jgi:hypothetical protein